MSDWQPWTPTYTHKFKWYQFRAKRNYKKMLASLKKSNSSPKAQSKSNNKEKSC